MLDGIWLEPLLLYLSLLCYFLSELNKWHTSAVQQSNHQIKVENHIIYQLKFNNWQESGYLESGNLESGKSQESYPFTFDIDLSVLNFGFFRYSKPIQFCLLSPELCTQQRKRMELMLT